MRKIFSIFRLEEWLLLLALVLGFSMALYAPFLDVSFMTLVDSVANTIHARMVLHSITPGFTQTGMYWHPMMPLLLLPFMEVPFLFQYGLSASFAVVPLYAFTTIVLYKIGLYLTQGNRMASATAAVLFAINPFILFYATTGMSEIPYQFFFLSALLFLTRWMRTDSIRDLVICGLFVSFSAFTRQEGWFYPIILTIIVFIRLLLRRTSYSKMEAIFMIFWMWAVTGVLYYFVTAWIFHGDPFVFIPNMAHRGTNYLPTIEVTSELSPVRLAESMKDKTVVPPYPSIITMILICLQIAYNFYGLFQVWFALGAVLVLLLLFSRRYEYLVTVLLLIEPIPILLYFMRFGQFPMGVPEYPMLYFGVFIKQRGYYENRFLLHWAGMLLLLPCVFIHYFSNHFIGRISKYIGKYFQIVLLGLLIVLASWKSYTVVFRDQYASVKLDSAEYRRPDNMQDDVDIFESLYDGGKVFIIKKYYEFFLVKTHIPLSRFIWEGNYGYYQQTYTNPWLFVRWFCMPMGSGEQKAFSRLVQSLEFHRYYNQEAITTNFTIYRLREDMVRADAEAGGLNIEHIPSLNPGMDRWDPSTIMWDIGFPGDGNAASSRLLSPPSENSPEFENGSLNGT